MKTLFFLLMFSACALQCAAEEFTADCSLIFCEPGLCPDGKSKGSIPGNCCSCESWRLVRP